MTDGHAHRGQEATAVVKDDDVAVGLLQNLEISVPREYSTLTGAGTNKVVEAQQTLVEPELSAGFGTFDETAFETLIDLDDVAEEIRDTAEPPEFDVEVSIPSVNGETTKFELIKGRPDPTTLDIDPDEFAVLNLDLTGRDIEPL